MKTLTILTTVMMMYTFSLTNAQVAWHRGEYPRLLENGKVVDVNGRKLGSVTTDGRIMLSNDKVIALISATGEVTYANGKGTAGTIAMNVFTAATQNYVATLEEDGAVMLNGGFAAFVDRGYPLPKYASVLHFFFGYDKRIAKEVDAIIL
jgi:hypothetical protein